jgi:prepilin peptidase CpaA
MVLSLFILGFIVLCCFAAVRDVATLTIPNWLNGWLAFLFLPACILAAPGWDVAGWHVIAGTIAFVIAVLAFMFGLFGGGDAKMIPGVILWVGPAGAMPFIYGMALSGGILALLVILARRAVPAYAAPDFAYETLQPNKGVPYGVAIAIGAFYAAPHSPILTQFLN